MLKKSVYIYGSGFVFGVISSTLIISVYPSLYHAFLAFLTRKVEVQAGVIENFTLMIIANNLLAASIASFGGVGVSKMVGFFDNEFAGRKSILYFLPVGVLFVNGEVLGLFAVLYKEHITRFLYGIFPHGFFEIPAILISGAIGLEISEKGAEFQNDLNILTREKLRSFGLVVLLILIGGLLEGSSV